MAISNDIRSLLLLLAFTIQLLVLASFLRFRDHTQGKTQSAELLWTTDQPVADNTQHLQ